MKHWQYLFDRRNVVYINASSFGVVGVNIWKQWRESRMRIEKADEAKDEDDEDDDEEEGRRISRGRSKQTGNPAANRTQRRDVPYWMKCREP